MTERMALGDVEGERERREDLGDADRRRVVARAHAGAGRHASGIGGRGARVEPELHVGDRVGTHEIAFRTTWLGASDPSYPSVSCNSDCRKGARAHNIALAHPTHVSQGRPPPRPSACLTGPQPREGVSMAPERWWSRAVRTLALVTSATCLAAPTAHALRIVDYNILNYPGTTGPARDPSFRTILQPISPDVLVTEETNSQAGVTEFLNSLNTMEPGQWAALPFIDGNDTDCGLFYKPSKIGFASQWSFYPN